MKIHSINCATLDDKQGECDCYVSGGVKGTKKDFKPYEPTEEQIKADIVRHLLYLYEVELKSKSQSQ